MICERCEERRTERDPKVDGTYREEFGRVLCDDCMDSLSEAAYERMLDRYYGSDSPQTITESYQQAAAVKRGM